MSAANPFFPKETQDKKGRTDKTAFKLKCPGRCFIYRLGVVAHEISPLGRW